MTDHKKDSKYRFAFRYHSDGQSAQAAHGGKSENFLRGGLVLIRRGKLPMRVAVVRHCEGWRVDRLFMLRG